VDKYDDIEVIFPVHKNPLVQEMAALELGGTPRVHLVDPLDYEPFANLLARSYMILSDSGGIQEEAPSLGKPVLVLRDTTERPEAVAAGTVKLVATDSEKIYETASRLLEDNAFYRSMSEAVNPYGDGKASARIVQTILYKNGLLKQEVEYFCSKY
jgi:UDP-N-acetylglucosamine 2-epimerase (non-hydrolysing)